MKYLPTVSANVKFCGKPQSEMKFAHFRAAKISHAPAYFTYRRYISLARRANFVEKTSSSDEVFSWQGRKDSNSGHAVLETAVLPTELHPCGFISADFVIISQEFSNCNSKCKFF